MVDSSVLKNILNLIHEEEDRILNYMEHNHIYPFRKIEEDLYSAYYFKYNRNLRISEQYILNKILYSFYLNLKMPI